MVSQRVLTIVMLTSVLPRREGDATPPFVLNQARALVRAGHRVIVLAPHGESARFSEEIDGVRILRFAYFFPLRFQKLCYEGGMLINFRSRPWTKLLLPFFIVSEFFALVRSVNKYSPDLIHSHSLLPQSYVAGIVANLVGIPHVATSHGNDVFGMKRTGVMGWFKRKSIESADYVTANSSATIEAVLKSGCSLEKIRLVPATPSSEYDLDKVDERKRVQSAICFVGRLIQEKGVEDLLRAFSVVRNSHPNASLAIVGDGQERAFFERVSDELDLQQSCKWLGWMDRDGVRGVMEMSRVLVVPSRSIEGGWKEAQGLVIVEGMLAKTSIVATRTGGIQDMVFDGENGRLVSSENVDDLAGAILDLLGDEVEASRIARNGCRFAQERFSVQAVTKLIESVYYESIA